MDGEILQVLRDVVGRLDALQTDYMLTGSLALGYYVEPRMTRDIDIVVEFDTFDASSFMREFEASYYVPRELIEAADERGRIFNLIEHGAIVKVDFVIRRGGEYIGNWSFRAVAGCGFTTSSVGSFRRRI